MIRLSSFFSNGLILQRDVENPVYGYTEVGSEVTIELKKHECKNEVSSFKVQTTADLNGYFEIILPKIEAGRNYEIRVSSIGATNSCSDECIIKDVAFGDVFLCGGQSNMQLPISRTMERYEEEIKNTNNSDIRFFTVPEKYDFHKVCEEIEGGNWVKATYPDIVNLGATAYFSAKHIYEKHQVPIGIYNTAIGGTPIKAWMSEESVRKLNLHVDEFEECLDDEFVKKTIERECVEDKAWREEAYELYDDGKFDVSKKQFKDGVYVECENSEVIEKGKVLMPDFFKGSLENRCMSIRLTKKIYIDENWLVESDRDNVESANLNNDNYDLDDEFFYKLYLGAIIDSDKTYVNGVCVGDTGYLYPPRIYKIGKGILNAGENIIEVRMVVFRNVGGFMPGMDYYLKNRKGETISLEGDWKYEVVKDMPYIENLTFFSYKPAGVFNGMIYPLRKQQVAAVLFYQGESNIEEYENYKLEFETAINDWRKIRNNESLPFIYVQIAAFSEGKLDCGDKRARLADEQYKCLEVPNTAMVQAYDIGEYNELHPTNKNEVGRRISEAVEKLVYEKEPYVSGPVLTYDGKSDEGFLFTSSEKLIFSHGIDAKVDKNRDEENICGFYYVKDGKRIKAEATFADKSHKKILVKVKDGMDALSYAWSDSPVDANLYAKNRLPVIPFIIKIGQID